MKKIAFVVLGVLLAFGASTFAARNSSGTYSLPSSVNPVTSGSTITTTWANTTLNDLATEITNSLDRGGRGSMLAPLKVPDGSVTVPVVAFTSEPGTGLYRKGANNPAFGVNQVLRQEWTTTGTAINGTFAVSSTSNFTGLATFGNASVGGTLGVTGISTFTDLATFNNGATVASGNVALSQVAGQSVLKSGGALTLGTSDANDVKFQRAGADVLTLGTSGPAFTGKPTATATVGGDGSATLTTKGYVDGGFLAAGSGYTAGNSGANLDLLGQADTVSAPSSNWGRLSNRRTVVGVSGAPAAPVAIDGGAGIALPMAMPVGWSNEARLSCWQVPGFSVNSLSTSVGNAAAFTLAGGGVGQTWSSATLKGRLPRIRSTQTNGSDVGSSAAVTAWRGNAAGAGGFVWVAEWGLGGTPAVNQRVCVGLAADPTTCGSSPYARADTAFFGCNTEDNLQFCSNDNSGSATCTDLGSNFPCGNGVAQNTLFRSAIWSAPNGSTLGWAIERLDSGPFTASGTVSVSGDLPRNTVQLGPQFMIFDTSTTGTIDVVGLCLAWNP